jgi:hypothetical protein
MLLNLVESDVIQVGTIFKVCTLDTPNGYN